MDEARVGRYINHMETRRCEYWHIGGGWPDCDDIEHIEGRALLATLNVAAEWQWDRPDPSTAAATPGP